MRHQTIAAMALFLSYLVFSISFVGAYSGGRVSMQGVEPRLTFLDDLEPVFCGQQGFVKFRITMENIPAGVEIVQSEAFIRASSTNDYNINDAITCSPSSGIIPNQEITCSLDVKKALEKLPACPLSYPRASLYVNMVLRKGQSVWQVSNNDFIVINPPGLSPEMDVQPSSRDPRINCMTGSIINFIAVVSHAETLSGEPEFSGVFNGTRTAGVECTKSIDGEFSVLGKTDAYSCSLTLPDTFFRDCSPGEQVPVTVVGKNRGLQFNGSFAAELYNESLHLRLSIGRAPTPNGCQIIEAAGENEAGAGTGKCIPTEPQKEVRFTLTGNVPPGMQVFDVYYTLEGEQPYLTKCEQKGTSTFECPVFVTFYDVPLPEDTPDDMYKTTAQTRTLQVKASTRYINYFQEVSGETKITYEGRLLSTIINSRNNIGQSKGMFDKLKQIGNMLNRALKTVELINKCCSLVTLAAQAAKESGKKAAEDAAKKRLKDTVEGQLMDKLKLSLKIYLRNNFLQKTGDIVGTIASVGFDAISCLIDEANKQIGESQKNLKEFEQGSNKTAYVPPDLNEYIKGKIDSCIAKAAWRQFSFRFLGLLCGVVMFVVAWFFPPAVAICASVGSWASAVSFALNMIMMLIAVMSYQVVTSQMGKNLAMANEMINLQTDAAAAMEDYQDKLILSMSSMLSLTATAGSLKNILQGPDELVYLQFISPSKGVINEGDEVCSGDSVVFEYNFDKLAFHIQDYTPRMNIYNRERLWSKDLVFPRLNGTYGPIEVRDLFEIPETPQMNPSGDYIFTVRFGSQAIDYTLRYNNETCI